LLAGGELLAVGLNFFEDLLIVSQIDLGPDQYLLGFGAMVIDLREPFGSDIVERGGRYDREAEEEDVGFGIAQRAKSSIFFLTSRVPEREIDVIAVDFDSRREIIEDGRDIIDGKAVLGVGDEEAGFADGAVADDHAFHILHRHFKQLIIYIGVKYLYIYVEFASFLLREGIFSFWFKKIREERRGEEKILLERR